MIYMIKNKVLEELGEWELEKYGLTKGGSKEEVVEKSIEITEKLTREECADDNSQIAKNFANKIVNFVGNNTFDDVRKEERQRIQQLIELIILEDYTVEKALEKTNISISEATEKYSFLWTISNTTNGEILKIIDNKINKLELMNKKILHKRQFTDPYEIMLIDQEELGQEAQFNLIKQEALADLKSEILSKDSSTYDSFETEQGRLESLEPIHSDSGRSELPPQSVPSEISKDKNLADLLCDKKVDYVELNGRRVGVIKPTESITVEEAVNRISEMFKEQKFITQKEMDKLISIEEDVNEQVKKEGEEGI
jgi:hypothetical protein